MKLKILLIVSSLLVFNGCFGPGDSSPAPNDSNSGQPSEELRSYDNNEIFLTFPSNWDVIQPADFTADVPDETLVVIRNNIKNENFTANVNVTKNELAEQTASIDYATQIINGEKNSLLEFKEISRNRINLPVGNRTFETYLIEFEAKLNPTDPALRFIQIAGVKNSTGYVVLGATSLQEQTSVVNSVSNTVKSFKIL
ncbi:hypothetical protein GF376_04895 [Candidatus Peregrinibacteria bacterium]|nr:hypothetical protein [Candidatus Peregrinibacteria bacterium]